MMKNVLWIVLTISILGLTGCSQSRQEIQSEAIEARTVITADYIVRYYKSDASAYMTRQRHGYSLSDLYFQAESTEPTGSVRCVLDGDLFTLSGHEGPTLSDLPKEFWTKNLAISVYYSFCAGAGLIDVESMTQSDNLKVEGQWYRTLIPELNSGPKVTLLHSSKSNRMELLLLEDDKSGLSWLVRNYNLRYSKDLGSLVPRMIDIFDIRDGIASKELMIQFDCKNIQK